MGSVLLGLALESCLPPSPTQSTGGITHGPILGRVSSHGVAVWVRTLLPGTFYVRYGRTEDRLNQLTEPAETRLEADNTGWIEIKGLEPGTEYFYRVVRRPTDYGSPELGGSFRTLPDAEQLRDALNPAGDFNFSFEFGTDQIASLEPGLGPSAPAYDQMLRNLRNKVSFAVLLSDWGGPAPARHSLEDWLREVRADEDSMPRLVHLAPAITGFWQNFKLYLSRARNFAEWHREVPSFFLLDEASGNREPGSARDGPAAAPQARTLGTRAWFDYLGWSHPALESAGLTFGQARCVAGSPVLEDPEADFTSLDTGRTAALRVLARRPEAAGPKAFEDDAEQGDPNAGEYQILEVLDRHRLRVKPACRADGEATYAILPLWHARLRISNAEFYFLDPEGWRLGTFGKGLPEKNQRQRVMESMKASDAEVFFVFPGAPFSLQADSLSPAAGAAHSAGSEPERDRWIRFWESLAKPVILLTGDLSSSLAVRISERVWEFVAGPHNARPYRAGAGRGGRPPNGPIAVAGRRADLRWSTFFREDAPPELSRQPVYTVIQVNNVFNSPVRDAEPRWVRYPRPQIVVQFYDGFTGDLLYAESILAGR